MFISVAFAFLGLGACQLKPDQYNALRSIALELNLEVYCNTSEVLLFVFFTSVLIRL